MTLQDLQNDAWLLLALLAGGGPALPARLNALSSQEWDDLVVEAHRHGVAPLLHHRLQLLQGRLTWPTSVRETLEALQRQTAVDNLQAYRQLLELLDALYSAGVPVVALKGIQIAQEVYGNVSLRPMTDLDLLIRHADLPQVESTLSALAYTPFTELAERQWYLDHHYHVDYIRRHANAKIVELHWRLVYPRAPFDIDLAGLWQRAHERVIAGVPVTFFAPEDLLLHLCLQMTYHHLFDYYPLRLLCDITECVRHYGEQFDWSAFVTRAFRWGAANNVYLTLFLAQKWLGASVPPQTLRQLEPPTFAPQFEHYARQRMRYWYLKDGGAPRSDGFTDVWTAEHFGERVRAFVNVMLPPTASIMHRYGLSSRVDLLWTYPRHWYGITSRHLGRAWRLAHGDQATAAWASGEVERALLEKWLKADRRLTAT